jgi:hypothetical protein
MAGGMPMPRLYEAVKNTMLSVENSVCLPAEVMALAYAESVANPWMCDCSSTDRAEFNRIPWKEPELSRWLRTFTKITSGVNKGKLARFTYDHEIYREQALDPWFCSLSMVERIVLACRWGMFKKPGFHIVLGEEKEQYFPKLWRFMGSPALQIETAVRDLNQLIPRAEGNFALAAARYHGGPGLRMASRFGNKCEKIKQTFYEGGCT